MYITYKTTCIVTGKYYIGSHKLSKVTDRYLGSGKALIESIQRYGVENHVRDVIAEFDTRSKSIELEHQLIKKAKDAGDSNILNLSTGGSSFDYINESGKNLYPITSDNLKIRLENLSRGRKTQTHLREDLDYCAKVNANISKGVKAYFESHQGNFKGRHHSDATKQLISDKLREKSRGDKNSQYGSYWITNGITNTKWRDSKGPLPEGFKKGRVC